MKRLIPLAVLAVLLVARALRHLCRGERPTKAPRGPSAARRFVETHLGDVGLVAAREFRERTRGRIYRVGTLVILAAVAAAVIIPALNKSSSAPARAGVGVIGTLDAPLRSAITAAAREVPLTAHVVAEPSLATAEAALRAGTLDAMIVDGRRIVVQQGISATDSSDDAQLAHALATTLSTRATLNAAQLSPAQLARLTHPVRIPVTGLEAAARPAEVHATTIIGLILLFVLLSQYSAWILIGVAEEKSSRVVEVLLATVRAIHLLTGKVLGIGAAALAQATVVVGFALVLAKIFGSDILKGAAPLDLVSSLAWLVLGYAFYCWVYAAAGSLTERQSQLQSMSFPLALPMLFGYIVSITTASSGNASTFFKVLAYLPPTAPFAMPVLVGLGQATWWGFLLAVALSLAATVGVAQVAAGIYRRAILRTGQRVRIREVLRADH
ncbi:MAG TPA: ABC transporter permease [Acidimicrobiales bacterium]|nr:ABC transporter permease [Acidimicrobiales bacterium]